MNDASLFDRAEDIWERGTNRGKMFKGLVDKYSWVELGGSFYPSEFQAAFLLAQLEHIEDNLAERKTIHEEYYRRLLPLAQAGRIALPRIDAGRTLNYHSCYIVFPSVEDCDRVRENLKKENIQAYIGYVPLHSSPVGQRLGYRPEDLPITEEYAQRVLRLPFHNELSRDDIARVCDGIARGVGMGD